MNNPQDPAITAEEETRSPSQSSVLFARYMIWGVLVLLAVSIWYRVIPLILIGTFLLVMSLSIMGWKRQALTRVQPTLSLFRTRVFAGEEVELDATVRNDKWLPLVWLEWEMSAQKGVTWDEQGGPYRIRFLWLLWYQMVSWSMKGRADHRGVYQLGNVMLRSGDGFRFAEEERVFDLSSKLYVYPRMTAVKAPPLSPSLQWGMNHVKGGFIEDPLLMSGTRDYQSGDEWRRIHWQASARTGTLQTRVNQPVVVRQVMFFIDVSGFERVPGDEFERFLSVVASVAASYHRQGIAIGYACNARTNEGQRMAPSLPSSSLTPFLDMSAAVTSRASNHDFTAKGLGRVNAPVFYFSHHITEKHLLWLEQRRSDFPAVRFYSVQDSPIAQRLGGAAKRLDTLLSTSKGVGVR
jgi:hypothetical protein